VASLLELPLEDMPVVPAAADFNEVWRAWLYSRGLARVVFQAPEPGGWYPEGYGILVGTSPRGLVTEDGSPAQHAVVGLNGVPIHDPYPGGNYLEDGVNHFELIYRMDWAGMALPNNPEG
jgi:hypothetical protein